MNTNTPENDLPNLEQISAAYRGARFDEAPSGELNRAILAKAERSTRGRLSSFLPAFAVAATVLLSVSLVMRSGVMNESAEVPTGGAVSDVPQSLSPSTFTIEQDSGVDASDTISTNEAEAEMAPLNTLGEPPAPALQEVIVTGGQPDDAFATEAPVEAPVEAIEFSTPPTDLENIVAPEMDAPQPAGIEQRARHTTPMLRQESAAQSAELQSLSAESSTLEEVVITSPLGCPDEGDPEEWLACIEDSAESGLIDEALGELDAFVTVFPDYALPETFKSLLNQ